MATINGKPSVFITPPAPKQDTDESPTPFAPSRTVDYATHVQLQIDDAIKFAQQLQAWLDDDEAQAEYQEWSESCRESEPLPTPTDAEKRADMHELSRLGDGALHCIAGHDLKWQQGGS